MQGVTSGSGALTLLQPGQIPSSIIGSETAGRTPPLERHPSAAFCPMQIDEAPVPATWRRYWG